MIARHFRPFAVALAGAACIASAHASFVDSVAASQWTVANTNGGNGTVQIETDTMTLTSADFTGADSWDFYSTSVSAAIALAAGTTVSFDWSYATADDGGSSYDVLGYVLNGVYYQLSSDGSWDAQSGTVSFTATTDSSFSLVMSSADGWGGSATAVISDFEAVPEPASLALALVGLGGIGFTGARRRRG